MALFGKRKTPLPAAKTYEPPSGAGTFGTVIVPRSAADRAHPEYRYRLVGALVRFVNAMTGEGLYTRFELLPKATQAFHADFYQAEVLNGGHPQFIHNSHGNLGYAVADMLAAMEVMQVEPYLTIARRFNDWMTQNPDTREAMRGARGKQMLHELDQLFYAANRERDLSYALADWIAGWPELRVVDDADYPEAIRLSCSMNPLREIRQIAQSIGKLKYQLTDRLQATIGLACANAPGKEMKLAIGATMKIAVDGAELPVWHLRTNMGERICHVREDGATLYEFVRNETQPLPPIGDTAGWTKAIEEGRLLKHKLPTGGQKLSEVKAELITSMIEVAQEHQVALAVDLSLRKAGIATKGALISPTTVRGEGERAVGYWMILADNQPLFAMSGKPATMLFRMGAEKPFIGANSLEVEVHAERAKAARATVGPELDPYSRKMSS